MKKKTPTRSFPRHPFRFRIEGDEGETKIFTAWAKIRFTRKPVTLTLTAADVRKSIAAKGIGNTQTCSMAMCAKRLADEFDHPVEGYIDWQYRTAQVVSRIDRETGLPSECVPYVHNNGVAHLNDTKGGQKKLLKILERDGPMKIKLIPRKPRHGEAKRGAPEGRRDGSRTPRPIASQGAKLRFAMAKLGGAI